MNFSKNTKVTLSVLACGFALFFPKAANAESLVNKTAQEQEQKNVLQAADYGEFSTLQDMTNAMSVKKETNAAHIEVLRTLYKNYLDDEDNSKLDSLLEESSNADTHEKLVKVSEDIDAEKTYLEEKKQKAIAEAEAKRKAAEAAAAREAQAQSYSSSSSSTSSSGQYSSDTGDARSFIIQKESGGNYTAENGRYYGAYQLDRSYLNGDYSAENQDRTAENYVANRYGSWEAAREFWQQHGWY